MGESPSENRYDAFISYRHTEPDRTWATWLHRALEGFRTPRALVAAGHAARFRRVFRDEDEVPASSDLSREIDGALERSSFLIVVCSPRTPESKWVDQEVSRFRVLGRHDRILALLVEGEPADAFPPSLREIRRTSVSDPDLGLREEAEDVEPLAADVRPRPDSSARIAKRLALLRLCACLLGCRFDDLRQRERERRRRRMRRLAAATATLLAGFGVLGLLVRRNAERADRERVAKERALTSEATERLVGQSRHARERDPMLALLLARAAVDRSATARTITRLHEAVFESTERARTDVGEGAELLAASPRGDVLVRAGSGAAVLWTSAEGKVLTFPGSPEKVRAAVFSGDGARLATIAVEGGARLRDRTGVEVAVLPSPGRPFERVACSAAGDAVLLETEGGEVSLWRPPRPALRIPGVAGALWPGRERVYSSEAGVGRLRDYDGRPVATFPGHATAAFDVRFEPGGRHLLTLALGADGIAQARLWTEEGRLLSTTPLDGMDLALSTAGEPFCPTGRWFVLPAAAGDRLFKIADGTSEGLGGSHASFGPDGSVVLVRSGPRELTIRAMNGTPTAQFFVGDARTRSAFFGPAGHVLATTEDGTARMFGRGGQALAELGRATSSDMKDLPSASWAGPYALLLDAVGRCRLHGPQNEAGVLAVPPAQAAGTRFDGESSLRVGGWWDLVGPDQVRRSRSGADLRIGSGGMMAYVDADGDDLGWFPAHEGEITSSAWSSDASLLVTTSEDGTARLWSYGGQEPRTVYRGHRAPVARASFGSRGTRLLSISRDGEVHVWDLQGKELGRFREAQEPLPQAFLSPSGDRVLVLSNGVARLVTLRGETTTTLGDAAHRIDAAAWMPDGERVATLTDVGDLRLWGADGRMIASARGDLCGFTGLDVSPSGRIATVSDDRRVQIWSAEAGLDLVATLPEHPHRVLRAVFSPGERRLLTAAEDGVIRLWFVDPRDLLDLAERRTTRALTAGERERYGLSP